MPIALAMFVAACPVAAEPHAPCNPQDWLAYDRIDGPRWLANPDILLLGDVTDKRAALVREAVAFWNDTLERTGSAFRLGAIIVAPLPTELAAWLPELSQTILAGGGALPPGAPRDLERWCGHIVIALSDGNFISFNRFMGRRGLTLIGLKGNDHFPFTLPNVPRNIIAHEISHAIGLRHNAGPTMLMCGRPASCRPTLFKSDIPYLFPLSDAEWRMLALKYQAEAWSRGK